MIVVDKPQGWTSHDVVNRIRRLANTKKVGHLGTLDPMATGVLPMVIGKATRLAQFYMHNDKVYEATVRFGHATDSYDRDGTPTSPETEPVLDPAEVERVFAPFRGVIQQVPPPISAKKIAGKPAYRLARKNIPVELKPVEVTVYSLDVLGIEGRDVRVRIHCSAGTYLRSIAHEAGQALGCGAYLDTLRRVASGNFHVGAANSLEELDKLAGEQRLGEVLIPAVKLLPEFPNEMVDTLTAGQIRQGRDFRVSPFQARAGARYVKAVTRQGELVAIGEAKLPHLYHPILVL